MQGWLKQSGSFSLSFDEWHKNNGKKKCWVVSAMFFLCCCKAVKFMSKVLSRLLRFETSNDLIRHAAWITTPKVFNECIWRSAMMHSLITTDNNNTYQYIFQVHEKTRNKHNQCFLKLSSWDFGQVAGTIFLVTVYPRAFVPTTIEMPRHASSFVVGKPHVKSQGIAFLVLLPLTGCDIFRLWEFDDSSGDKHFDI